MTRRRRRPASWREQVAAGMWALLWLGLLVGLWWIGAQEVAWTWFSPSWRWESVR